MATAGKVALGALAVAAAAATAAMVMLAKKSITMAVDFDESMRRVNTLAQLGQEGFEGMKEDVLDLSETLGKSATEMGDALYQVISATFEGAEAMIVLETGVKMATAGMAGQVESVDALTTVLNAWGLSAQDATRVADTFFLTIKYGKTTMAELAPAIGVVATMAANAGLSFEEVGAALSALTIVGVDTNRAVTGLSAILTALTKPTDEAKEAAKELGIDFSLTGLKAKGLSVWLGELKDATKGESEQLARFFQNVRAVRAVLPLATNAAEAFNNNLIKMQTETGAAQEAFEQMDLAYSRIIERLKVQFEAIYIAVGEDLVPELLEFAKILSDPEFLDSIKTVALGIADFATGVLSLVRGIGELSNAHRILIEEQKGLMEPTLIDFIKSQIKHYEELIENENKNIIIMGEGKEVIKGYEEQLGWWETRLEQLTSDQRAINDALTNQKGIVEGAIKGIGELGGKAVVLSDAYYKMAGTASDYTTPLRLILNLTPQVTDKFEDMVKIIDKSEREVRKLHDALADYLYISMQISEDAAYKLSHALNVLARESGEMFGQMIFESDRARDLKDRIVEYKDEIKDLYKEMDQGKMTPAAAADQINYFKKSIEETEKAIEDLKPDLLDLLKMIGKLAAAVFIPGPWGEFVSGLVSFLPFQKGGYVPFDLLPKMSYGYATQPTIPVAPVAGEAGGEWILPDVKMNELIQKIALAVSQGMSTGSQRTESRIAGRRYIDEKIKQQINVKSVSAWEL